MELIADLHIHTVSSGHAYSTIEEYVAQAKKIGLKIIGITDHGPAMPGGPHHYHFSNMKMIPEEMDGIRILRGVEANIINDNGEIDLGFADLRILDIVMLAFHPRCGYISQGIKKNTEVMIKGMNNPFVNIIAHPGNPMYPVDIETIVKEAKKRKIVLEINNSSFTSRPGSDKTCLEFAKEIKKQGWKAVIGSDAHFSTMVGTFSEALELVKKAGLKKEDIVNSSEDLLFEYLFARNKNV